MEIEYIGKCLLLKENGERILVIGDLHLGWEESLNRSGVFVSRKLFEESLEYLKKVFEKTKKVDKIILLGDVKHEFGGIVRQEWNDVSSLINFLEKKCEEVVIVKGNHDNILEPILRNKKNVLLQDCFFWKGVCFVHGDRDFEEMEEKRVKIWVIGHGHPAVKVGDGVKVEKYKCFLVGLFRGRKIVIVPSFFEGSAGSDPRENNLGLAWDFNLEKFEVKIVQDLGLDVLEFGILRNI